MNRNVDYYAKKLAKKHGIPIKIMRKILMFGMKNLCWCIYSSQDVRIPKFGHIYAEKKPSVRGLLSKKKREKANGKQI